MTALVASIITAVVTAVLAAVGTYVTTRRNLQIQFDASLREMRIASYKPLWARLGGLAKYARPEPLSRDEAQELAVTLRDWYFETGGCSSRRRPGGITSPCSTGWRFCLGAPRERR